MELYVEIKKKFPGFNLDIKFEGSKERIGLLGASGSGKSMTLRCIAGLVKPDEGKIVVNGKTYFDSKKKINIKPQNRKVGFLFQNYALFPHLTLKDNIQFGMSGLSEHQRNQKAMSLLEKFQLIKLENRYPHQISGGQQQRTALARTIATDPEILLLDEPFCALDEHLRSHMMKEMLEFLREFKGNSIFVTHNMEEAYRFCENLAVIGKGKVLVFGSKNDVFENPKTSEAAKITGCKNIAPAFRLGEEYLTIPMWNIKVKTNLKTKVRSGYCGIRANYIQLSSGDYSDNAYKARIVGNTETPFRQTVYLKFENTTNDFAEYHIQCEINKDVWNKLSKDSEFLNVHLQKDKIMYFES